MPPAGDFPRDGAGNVMSRSFRPAGEAGDCAQQGEHLCLKMLAGTRRMVEAFDWE